MNGVTNPGSAAINEKSHNRLKTFKKKQQKHQQEKKTQTQKSTKQRNYSPTLLQESLRKGLN